MPKFPVDAPKERMSGALIVLGFELVREGTHIAMRRHNFDGSYTLLTMPNHRYIKGSTLRSILTQAGISRNDFLNAYENTK